jgi:AcrR family transcriptional regulator
VALEEPTGRRRRGDELVNALLDAAWAEFLEKGYAEMTYEGVAERAGTSRSVVYRRWPGKQELALAALRHRGAADPLEVPDTGTLRGDLVAMLTDLNRRRAEMMALLGVHMGDYYRETGLAPGALRVHWLGNRGSVAPLVVERAVARGEVPRERVTPRAIRLASDLARHEILMTLRPMTDDVIESIVDDVVVPLLTGAPPRHAEP